MGSKGVELDVSGDEEWVDAVLARLRPILERHPRPVRLRQIGVSVGFTVPIGAGLIMAGIRIDVDPLSSALAIGGFLIAFVGSLLLSLQSDDLVRPLRIGTRSPPADSGMLRFLWQLVLGVVVTIIASGILALLRFPG